MAKRVRAPKPFSIGGITFAYVENIGGVPQVAFNGYPLLCAKEVQRLQRWMNRAYEWALALEAAPTGDK